MKPQGPGVRATVALGMLVPFLSGLVAGAATDSLDRAEYSYLGQATLEDIGQASCAATGLLMPRHVAGTLDIQAREGVLRIRQTWLNRTIVNGVIVEDPATLVERIVPFGPGHVRVAWGKDGTATVYTPGPGESLDVRWLSGRLDVSVLEPSPRGYHMYWRGVPGVTFSDEGSFAGPSRVVTPSARTHVAGNASILLHEATIDIPGGGHHELPPWRTDQNVTDGPIDRETVLLQDAFVDESDASWVLADGVGATVCRGLDARTANGAVSASGAAGRAVVGGATHSFAGQVISYRGAFDVSERTPPAVLSSGEAGSVTVVATGRFEAWGLDYVRVADGGEATAWALTATGGALLAALLVRLSWGPIVGAFYARFGRDRVLDHPLRRTLWELVQSSPGLPVSLLAERVGVRERLAAYHLRVLERNGLVRTWSGRRRGRPWRLVVPGSMPPVEAKRLVQSFQVENDPKLQSLQRLLGGAGMSGRALTDALVREFSLTERGARKVLQRASELGLIAREPTTQGNGEWIRCA